MGIAPEDFQFFVSTLVSMGCPQRAIDLALLGIEMDAPSKARFKRSAKEAEREDLLIGLDQIAEAAGVKRDTARKLIKAGVIPAHRYRGKYIASRRKIRHALNLDLRAA